MARSRLGSISCSLLLFACLAATVHGQRRRLLDVPETIFGNGAITSSYGDSSWCSSPSVTFTTAAKTASGTTANIIAFTPSNYCGLQLFRINNNYLPLSPYVSLTMLLSGATSGGQSGFQAGITSGGTKYAADLASYIPASGLPANAWIRVTIPLSAFSGLSPATATLQSVFVQSLSSSLKPVIYVDAIQLLPSASSPSTSAPTATSVPTRVPTTAPTTASTTAPTRTPTAVPTTAAPTRTPTAAPTTVVVPSPPPPASVSGATQRLKTAGNKLLKADGTAANLRGFNIADMRMNSQCWPTGTSLSETVPEVKRRITTSVQWGSNFIRLLLENHDAQQYPGTDGFATNPSDYLSAIQSIAQYVGTNHPGVYIMITIWQDPTLTTSADPQSGLPTAATNQRWARLVPMFKGMNHVMFGVINEPADNYDGALDAACWNAMNAAVSAIRAAEAAAGDFQHIIAVQGTRNFARVLDYYVTHPITVSGGANIVYETHPYNHQADWDSLVFAPAKILPVIIGELGPAKLNGEICQTLAESQELMKQAEAAGVPWLAWSFSEGNPPSALQPAHLYDDPGVQGDVVLGCKIGVPLNPNEWGAAVKSRLALPWGSA